MSHVAYALHSENLTHLGGPMGTEYTYDNWIKYFDSIEKAKAYALNDYRKETQSKDKLKWIDNGHGGVRTEDLLFVMYRIAPVKFEDE